MNKLNLVAGICFAALALACGPSPSSGKSCSPACDTFHKCNANTGKCDVKTSGSCSADADCASLTATPKCNTSTNLCVQCKATSDCAGGQVCSAQGGCVTATCSGDT